METDFIIINVANIFLIILCCLTCRRILNNRRINNELEQPGEIIIYNPPIVQSQDIRNYQTPYQTYPTMVIMPTAPPIEIRNQNNNEDPN